MSCVSHLDDVWRRDLFVVAYYYWHTHSHTRARRARGNAAKQQAATRSAREAFLIARRYLRVYPRWGRARIYEQHDQAQHTSRPFTDPTDPTDIIIGDVPLFCG